MVIAKGGLGGFVVLLGRITGECDRSKRSLSDLQIFKQDRVLDYPSVITNNKQSA
jgi:hypothetical protein